MRNTRLRIGLVLLLVISMSGCLGLHEGATQRSFGEMADDSMIVTAVNTHALRTPELSFFDVSVESHRGVVILYGNVVSAAVEQELVNFTRGLKGVAEVQSRLIVIPATPRR